MAAGTDRTGRGTTRVTALFDALFAVFVLSMAVIAVLAVRWGVRGDRAERRRRAEDPGGNGTGNPGLTSP